MIPLFYDIRTIVAVDLLSFDSDYKTIWGRKHQGMSVAFAPDNLFITYYIPTLRNTTVFENRIALKGSY